jgi:Arc/MetJ-type ribon-helix-helix transcriptional regulator
MVNAMPKTLAEKTEYGFVKVPEDLIQEVDKVVGKHGYRSRAEFVKEAIRRLLTSYEVPIKPELKPPLEHFNLNENGVQIVDRQLNRIIQVYFKPDEVFCEHDETDDCRHVEFALELPDVQNILRKKGWKPK